MIENIKNWDTSWIFKKLPTLSEKKNSKLIRRGIYARRKIYKGEIFTKKFNIARPEL